MTGVLSTEKKRVSVAMRINEAVDRVCDDHAYDAIIATDRGGKIQKVNAVAVTEFGYESNDELVGINLSVLMHGVIDHPEFLLDSHGKQRVISITRKDGSEMNCIVATRNIKGTPIVASYIRNLASVQRSLATNIIL